MVEWLLLSKKPRSKFYDNRDIYYLWQKNTISHHYCSPWFKQLFKNPYMAIEYLWIHRHTLWFIWPLQILILILPNWVTLDSAHSNVRVIMCNKCDSKYHVITQKYILQFHNQFPLYVHDHFIVRVQGVHGWV